MIELAHNNTVFIKIHDISLRWEIPEKFLEQILYTLKNNGYLESKKGKNGGYRLKQCPSKISIAEIIRLIDGPLAPVDSVSIHFYEKSPVEKHRGLHSFFREVRDVIADKLENTMLDSFVKKL